MSVTEILAELETLSPEELHLVQEKIDNLHGGEYQPTPEELEAIEEGERSLATGPTVTLEEMRREVASWHTK